MSSLGFLIVQNNFDTKLILYFGNLGLTFASAVTIYTGYIYFKKILSYFKMKNVFVIVGWSGSGKTHLICRIIKYLNNKKLNISSIKHSHHNFEVDKKEKTVMNT